MLVVIASGGVYAQTDNTPEGRVKSFYSWYLTAINNQADPAKNKTVMNSHLSKRFSRWFYSKAGQNVDSDVFVGSQEWDDAWADNIEVCKAVVTGNKAVLKVMLSAPPDEYVITLEANLVKEGSKWKIDGVKEVTEQGGCERMDTPESRVKDFYSWYLKAKASNLDPDKNRAVMNSHVSKRFSEWFYSKAVQNSDVGIFYNKGDWNRAWADNIEVGESYFTNDDNVVVKIQFSSPPNEFVMKLQLFLVKEGGKWKIDRVAGLFD